MRVRTESCAFALFLVAFSVICQVSAHTSVERLMRIANNGTMIGPEGFPRGFVQRGAGVDFDGQNVWLIPPNGNRPKTILPDDKIARSTQRTLNYTDQFKRLTAAPGDLVALQYQENGHVTLPGGQANKPANRGTVYIYGTSDFNGNSNLLDIHYKWNKAGTGGDGKGKLLATRNYDDGVCYQVNAQSISLQRQAKFPKKAEDPMGVNLWCQSDVSLPSDLPVGKPYTLLWVWDWPTMDRPDVPYPPSSAPGAAPGVGGATVKTPELYTTIMDVDVVDPCDDILGTVKGPGCSAGGTKGIYSLQETDLNLASNADQCKDMFLVPVDNSTNSAGSGSGSGSSSASASPSASTPSPTKTGKPAKGGRIKTTTVYTGVTTVTVTIPPSIVSSTPTSSLSSGAGVVTGTAGTSGSSLTVQSGPPTVTNFLKDTRPGTAKNRRRGQWGFGHG